MSSSTYMNGESSSLSQPLNFKVTHPSQQLARRLRFPTPPTYSSLEAKLVSLWSSSGLTASNLALSYLDFDGDRVVLSSDDELQGLFQELRQRGKEAEVVRMRVMVLGEEGSEGGGGQVDQSMDVEVEANRKQSEQVQQAAEVVATPGVVEKATVVERSEEPLMTSDDPFADHNQDADFIIVDDAASEERSRREVSSTPFDDDEHRPIATTTTSISHENPPTAMLVDDTEPSVAQAQAQAPDPAVAEDDHVDAVADDPEEIFPPAAEPQPQAQAQAQPSLLNDLSQLLTSITSSEALATILARAAQGAYAPNLASSASDIPSQVRSQVDHVRDQLTNGLGDAEGLLAGLGKAFKDGLEQVEQVRRERVEKEKEAREAEKETREEEKDQGRAEREKAREERELARQVRERAREQAQKEKETAQEERKKAEEEMREARKKAEDARRKAEEERRKAEEERRKMASTTTSTFGSSYAATAATPPPSALRPTTSLYDSRNPYYGLGGPQQHPNMFSPPPGPPPPPAPPASLFSSSNLHHPLPHPKAHQHAIQPHLRHPHYRHTWGAPGFPGGGMFGGGPAFEVEDATRRLRNLGAKLDEMGFKEGDYGVVLRRVLGEQGGEWRTDEEVVIEVVRELLLSL